MDRYKTVVFGASGLVAQRLQQRLYRHPMFELTSVAGSSWSGMSLEDVPWKLDEKRPDLPDLLIEDIHDENIPATLYEQGIRIAFSALPSQHAVNIEPRWAKAGITVFSNASSFRLTEGVPLVIPEINPLALNGIAEVGHPIVCATNCTLLPLIMPLAPLNNMFGLTKVSVRSEQALSGGGYGLLDKYFGNNEPFDMTIPGEAEKTEAEFRRILEWNGEMDIACNRVRRKDGHHVFVTAEFEQVLSVEKVEDCFQQWNAKHMHNNQPSAPYHPLMFAPKIDDEAHLFANGESFEQTPDPASNLKAGMSIVVASIECLNSRTVRFEGYSHNTLRGAAGGVVYLAELAHTMKKL